VTSGQGARFPTLSAGDYFYATLIDVSNNLEIVKVTARSTDVLTIVRAQESTTARAYSTGDRIELRLTAQTFVDATTVTPAAVSDQTNTSTGAFDLPAGTIAQRPGSPNTGMQRWNTDTNQMELYSGTAWVAFTPYNGDMVLVAGGGGGGSTGNGAYYDDGAGGGGAGGYLTYASQLFIPGSSYTITIGAGGSGGTSPVTGPAPSGGNTSVTGFTTAVGGGGGGQGAWNTGGGSPGAAGGSGGGSADYNSGALAGGSGTAGQGNAGGATPTAGTQAAGGGGGANAVGGNAVSYVSGSGGAGSTWLDGTTYAGGGGGGATNNGTANGTAGSGGAGGGGAGGAPNANGTAGTANRGGGGGGAGSRHANANYIGANGGSGVVIIRYVGAAAKASGGTITTSGGYVYHTFTSSGTYTA
jgi:hypothetical protein